MGTPGAFPNRSPKEQEAQQRRDPKSPSSSGEKAPRAGSDHGDPVLDVDVVWVAALLHLAGAGIAQDEAAHGGSKEGHDEEDVQEGVVITAGPGAAAAAAAACDSGAGSAVRGAQWDPL